MTPCARTVAARARGGAVSPEPPHRRPKALNVVTVRLTDHEAEILRSEAEYLDVTISDIMRDRLFGSASDRWKAPS